MLDLELPGGPHSAFFAMCGAPGNLRIRYMRDTLPASTIRRDPKPFCRQLSCGPLLATNARNGAPTLFSPPPYQMDSLDFRRRRGPPAVRDRDGILRRVGPPAPINPKEIS